MNHVPVVVVKNLKNAVEDNSMEQEKVQGIPRLAIIILTAFVFSLIEAALASGLAVMKQANKSLNKRID